MRTFVVYTSSPRPSPDRLARFEVTAQDETAARVAVVKAIRADGWKDTIVVHRVCEYRYR